MRGALLLALAVAAAAVAGCADREEAAEPQSVALDEVGPDGLADGAYLFGHAGGDVEVVLDGNRSRVDLFDAGDVRVGGAELGNNSSLAAVFPDVAGGPAVLVVSGLDGNLTVESAGEPVARFVPLGLHVERTVLAKRSTLPFGLGWMDGLVRPQPVELPLEVTLARAPTALRLFATDSYSDLHVVLESPAGTVLESDDAGDEGSAFTSPRFGAGFLEVAVQVHPENVRDGALRGSLRAADLHGALVLESWSYSRARLPGWSGPAPALGPPSFVYGALPDRPVEFLVHPSATRLVLTAEAADAPAYVALFGPGDARIATVPVPPNGTVEVPVAGGRHVAVALSGAVVLGADRAPSDFELHPLTVSETTYAAPRGPSGEYGGGSGPVDPPGVAFLLRAEWGAPGPLPAVACASDGYLALRQGEETIGYDVPEATTIAEASRLLDGSPLTLWGDGTGDSCDQRLLVVSTYARPTA